VHDELGIRIVIKKKKQTIKSCRRMKKKTHLPKPFSSRTPDIATIEFDGAWLYVQNISPLNYFPLKK